MPCHCPQHLREELQQRINRLKDAVMAASTEAGNKRSVLQDKLAAMVRLQDLEKQVGGMRGRWLLCMCMCCWAGAGAGWRGSMQCTITSLDFKAMASPGTSARTALTPRHCWPDPAGGGGGPRHQRGGGEHARCRGQPGAAGEGARGAAPGARRHVGGGAAGGG
jgi:hypothetical protein